MPCLAEARTGRKKQDSDHEEQQKEAQFTRDAARSCRLAESNMKAIVEDLDILNNDPSEETLHSEQRTPKSSRHLPVRFAEDLEQESPAQRSTNPSTPSRSQKSEHVKAEVTPKRGAPAEAARLSDGPNAALVVSPDLLHAALGVTPTYVASADAADGAASKPTSTSSKSKKHRHTLPAESSSHDSVGEKGSRGPVSPPQKEDRAATSTETSPQKEERKASSAVSSPRKPPLSPVKHVDISTQDPTQAANAAATAAAAADTTEAPAGSTEDKDAVVDHERLFAKLISKKHMEAPELPSLQPEGQSKVHGAVPKSTTMKQPEAQPIQHALPPFAAKSDSKPEKAVAPQLATDTQESPKSGKKRGKSAQGSTSTDKKVTPQSDQSETLKEAMEARPQPLKSAVSPNAQNSTNAVTDENSFVQPSHQPTPSTKIAQSTSGKLSFSFFH